MFVLRELQRFLSTSIEHWDPDNNANGLATARMEGLIDLVVETDLKTNNEDVKLPFDWVAISSHLFGTCMVHKVINNQVKMPLQVF